MDGQTDFKIYMERQKTQNILVNIILKKEQGWRTDIPRFKTYSKATVSKTLCYCQKNRQINGTE